MPGKLRATIVAAVSTPKQATEEKYSIPKQLEVSRDTCASRGWTVVREIVIPGHSRDYEWLDEIRASCAEYDQLIRSIDANEQDLIVAIDSDRLYRTDALRAQLTARCRQHKTQTFYVYQPVDPVPPELLGQGLDDSRLIVEAVGGVINQIENSKRKRRVRVGLEGRIASGLANCHSSPPMGYAVVGPDQPMAIVPEEAEWVRWIFARRLDGWGYERIARELNEMGIRTKAGRRWSRKTVRDILDNAFYCGEVHWGAVKNENGRHEPIVSRATYLQAQRIARQLRGRMRPESLHELTGLCSCGFCGGAMVHMTDRRPGHSTRLSCGHYVSSGGRQCQSNSHLESFVRDSLIRTVQKILNDPEAYITMRQQQMGNISAAIAQTKEAMAEKRRQWERWNDAFERGAISLDEMLQHRQRLHGEIDRLRTQQADLDEQITALEAIRGNLEEMRAAIDYLPRMPWEERRAVFCRLIRRVVLKRTTEGPHIERIDLAWGGDALTL